MPPASAVRRPGRWHLPALLAGLALTHLGYALLLLPRLETEWASLLADRDGYREIGACLAAGHGYTDSPGGPPTIRRMPAYPLLLAGLETLAGPGRGPVWAVQLGLVLAAAWACYRLAANRAGHRAGLLAAAALGAHPLVLAYTPRYYSEMLSLACVAAALLFAARFLSGRRRADLLLAALAVGGAWMTRASLLYVAILATVYLAIRLGRSVPVAWWLAAAGLTAAIGTPWVARNAQVSGAWVIGSTWDGRSALHGLILTRHPDGERNPGPIDAEAHSTVKQRLDPELAGLTGPRREVAEDRLARRAWLREVLAEPGAAILASLRGLARVHFQTTSASMRAVAGLANLTLIGLALWGWAAPDRRRTADPLPGLLWIPLLSLVLLHAVLYPHVRYLLPVLPALAVLAAWGADAVLTRAAGGTEPADES